MAAIDEAIAEIVEDCLAAGHTDESIIAVLQEGFLPLPPYLRLLTLRTCCCVRLARVNHHCFMLPVLSLIHI